jgi:hypothetical protein
MAAGSPPATDARPDTEISVHESGPGTSVFLESGNADGWIASDVTVDVRR